MCVIVLQGTHDENAKKVFYAVQATGRGHLSRYLVVRRILERAGAEVFAFASGQQLPSYVTCIDRFDPGPTFFIRNNRIDLLGSLLHNSRNMAGFFRSIRDVTQMLAGGAYDEIVVDFEPITARAAARGRRPIHYLRQSDACPHGSGLAKRPCATSCVRCAHSCGITMAASRRRGGS